MRKKQLIGSILFLKFFLGIGMSSFPKKVQVLISGGGPAGILSAHCLLSRRAPNANDNIRQNLYEVDLVESRDDPRNEAAGPRAYSLGLNCRGQSAIKYFDTEQRSLGLWNAIKNEGVESDSFFLHIGKRKIQIRKPSENNLEGPPPTLMIPRNKLCGAMLNSLEKNYKGLFNIRFRTKVEKLDLNSRVARFSDGTEKQYDLILGADGVNSAIRSAMESHKIPDFVSEEVVLPGGYKVMINPSPLLLEEDAIHAMESTARNKSGFGLFLIPAPGNKTCTLVAWRGDDTPELLKDGVPFEDVKTGIYSDFPLFGFPSDESVAQLAAQKPGRARTIRCNRYHHLQGRALLVGDAAHSTGGTLGQGANSALLDVKALDQILDEFEDNLVSVLPVFSERQTPEGLALWQLLQLPPKFPVLALFYQLSQLIQGVLSTNFPFLPIPKPTQIALSQTLTPFSQIVSQNKLWVELATQRLNRIDPFTRKD